MLDTHIALWAIAGDPKLGVGTRTLIDDPEHQIFVSAASIWEIAIKHALQRGRPNDMPVSGRQALADFVAAGYMLLPVTADHAAAVDTLPAHHADPFDRLIVAQAIAEPLHLLTRDRRLAAYGPLIRTA